MNIIYKNTPTIKTKSIGIMVFASKASKGQPKGYLVTLRMYQLNFDGNNEWAYSEYWDQYENHFIEDSV